MHDRRYGVPNNAWTAGNNPAGDGRYVTDATCPKLNDPLTVKLVGTNSSACAPTTRIRIPAA